MTDRSDEVVVVATGDVVPTHALGAVGGLPPGVRGALTELHQADIAFGTLEAALTERGSPVEKVVMYRASPSIAMDVAAMGFDVVSLANNQTLNYGLEGLEQTIEVLEAAGVQHVGAGVDAVDAWKPLVVTRRGRRVAFVAFTCVAPSGWAATDERGGLAALRVRTAYEVDARWEQEEPGVAPRVRTWLEEAELQPIRDAVARARAEAEIVIASVHWGVGSSAARAEYQEQVAATLTEAGVSCVLGSHPPSIQGLQVRAGSLVSYSQGTFVRQQPRPAALAAVYAAMPRSGCLLRLRFPADGGLRATVIPTLLGERDMAGLVGGADAETICDEIRRRSDTGQAQGLSTGGTIEISIE